MMRDTVGEFYEVLDAFTREGRHPVRDLLDASPSPFASGEHYPPGDIEDRGTGSSWYYHAHAPNEARAFDEHGHFHCFMYTELLADTARPIALPQHPDLLNGGLVHLIAISFDANGVPTRLFAPNRWVTDEWMYPADDVVALIECFSIVSDPRFSLTSRWLAAILRLCHSQIETVLRERDRVLDARRKIDPDGFTEDRSVEIVSSLPFDLDAAVFATS